MGKLPDKFYSDPSITIFVSVPSSKASEAMRQLRVLAHNHSLRIEIAGKRRDPDMPKSIFHTIVVRPNYKIDSAQKLVKASNSITMFQSQFQMAIFSQNLPSNIKNSHGIDPQ